MVIGVAFRRSGHMLVHLNRVHLNLIWDYPHLVTSMALRAEAAVLAGHPAARDRVASARVMVTGNPVASAQMERVDALLER
jgi:hypothetical protein